MPPTGMRIAIATAALSLIAAISTFLLMHFFQQRRIPAKMKSEQCVKVIFPFAEGDLTPLFSLEDELERAIFKHKVGEYDGNEVGEGEATLYLYGPDAEALFQAVLPILSTSKIVKGGYALKRYGPPADGIHEERVDFK